MDLEKTFTLPEARLELAKSTNRQVWQLLEKPSRTSAEDEDLLLAAYTSLFHWKEVGTAVHHQRGCWLAAKVHISLEQPSQALYWAKKCLQITEDYSQEMEDFDLAYAREAAARSFALAGKLDQAKAYYVEAVELGAEIKDPQDKLIFNGDLQGGDWYGLATT